MSKTRPAFYVRDASPEDAARCADIYRPFVTDNWVSFETLPPDADEMARRIGDFGVSHGWLIAQMHDGQIAGYAYGSPHRSRAAYASSADVAIYIDPIFARLGIGRALYETLFARLAAKRLHAVFAGIALPNDASIGLHEAMGFAAVGIYREVGWKMDGWRDVGWWQKRL